MNEVYDLAIKYITHWGWKKDFSILNAFIGIIKDKTEEQKRDFLGDGAKST